ncbi:hypothetical protein AAFF_G00064720 [Aldrovandia affinis]|uniref:Transcription termination factor 1-like n=1 Tax=Aldrovandia affinis TaxID=143900 RepID=A0AAD7T3P9_9TELE|nr:hypothetical protein AAFF_G00064720 [Aldrovandia affinis]
MLETMFETSQNNCKRKDSETMTLLQLSSECPLLFVETPENSLDSVRLTERHRHSCGHEVKRRKKTKAQPKQMAEEQENVERKGKKEKGKRDVSDGAEMQEVPKVETAEQEQEVSQDREQAQGQETERKKKKRDKKQQSSKQEEMTAEQIPQERKKKKKKITSCSGQTEISFQDEITVGVEDCEVQTLIWKEELHELTLDLEGWNTDKLKYIDELREFIPDVEKKTEHAVYRLVKYDLPRFRQFKKAGARIKRGRYSNKELERLRKNVEDFLALTGINSSTKLFFPARYPNEKAHIIKLKNLHRFHLRMSAGICRPWHDIYHKGRKVFDFSSKGRFTEEEVHSLEKLHQLHGNNWMKLAELTGRSSYALEKRFSQQSQNKGSWTKTEQQALESALREHMVGLVEPGSQGPTIRRDQLYSKLPWTEVARKVGTRSWDQCRLKWMSLLKKKMAAGTPVLGGQKSREANIRLIKALYAMEVEDVAHVNWEDLTQEMGDVPPHYVQTRFYRMKVNWVPLWQSMSFGDVINFLHERILPQLEQKLRITSGKPTAGMEEAGTQQERFLFSEIFSDLMTTGEGSEEEEGGETVNF